MLLYAVTIFVSAFLLFQVQPVIAKMILPWFGGSSAVWSTCMVFFQAVLLLGYGYAHWLHERLSPRRQTLVHSALLLASLAVLPIIPNPRWHPQPGDDPSLGILGLLAITVGLPYFLLSSTSPLLQAWYARTQKDAVPYRLFALSNFASLLALLSYPPLVEPNLTTRMQGRAWSVLYCLFVLLCGATAWRADRYPRWSPTREDGGPVRDLTWNVRLLWVALSGCASILLLAVTTALTQDVAPIPFLWIVPLSLYLLSFIICFDRPTLYRRSFFMPLLAPALPAMLWLTWTNHKPNWHFTLTIALMNLALFVCCMVCHGELVRLKPHPRHLTLFYVMVSVGGVMGGLVVGILAPNLMRSYNEFPLGLGLCALLAVCLLLRTAPRRWMQGALVTGLAAFIAFAGYVIYTETDGYRFMNRNFYGRLGVYDQQPSMSPDSARVMVHGTINHGQQMLHPDFRRLPVSYFCENTGIGRAFRSRQDGQPWRIGILGMGCGTLAVYGRAGDVIRMYEINPMVPQVDNDWFTFMKDTPALVETAIGDGRLLLESEVSQQFDILVMDAFSGDSVPVHLVTLEAFQIYFRHLKPGGILAVNLTNRYLDLQPVIERAAAHFGRVARVYHTWNDEDDSRCFSCDWALVMDSATRAAAPALLLDTGQDIAPARNFPPWTDDFSNLLRILK